MTALIDDLSAVIRARRYTYAQETDLHLGIEAALREAGYSPTPEVRLAPRDRIDFVVDRVGIEVKIKGPRDTLHRQLLRYAESALLDELLVVTTCRGHRGLPTEVGGKPLTVTVIGGVA